MVEILIRNSKVPLTTKLLRGTIFILSLLVICVSLYLMLIEPWHTKWGATQDEIVMSLPSDQLMPYRKMITTRAITINASVDKVWPWLVQIGQDRGGFYSYDWLENLFGCNIKSVNKVVYEYQDLKVGDIIKLTQDTRNPGMPVITIETGKYMTLGNGEFWVWTFYLKKIDNSNTRLIIRNVSSWDSLKIGIPTRLLLGPASFIMERKMLYGIKERVENNK